MQPDQQDLSQRSGTTYAIAGLIGLALAMGVGRFAFTPLFPLMLSDAAISVTAGAWLAAANYLGYFVGALAALAIKGKPATLIRVALLANAGATLAMGYTHELAAWLAWRGLAGVASAFLLVFISALCLQRLSLLRRPMLSATVFSGVGAGISAVGTLCLVLDYVGFSSSDIWIMLGVASVVLSIVVWPVFTHSDHPAHAEPVSDLAAPPRYRRWPLIVSYGLFGFGYIIPATFLPAMAKTIVGNGWTFGLAWPVFGFAALVSPFIAAHVSRFASGLHVWRTSHLIMAVGVALPALVSGLAAIVVAAICVGGTFMAITMIGMQTAKQFGGAQPRRLMAAMTAAFAAGQLAGPLAVSWFVEPGADFSALLLIAAAALLSGAGLLVRRRT
ncbi:MAG TPA: YbfB/YjiJ family MFS transporter, partial [Burkholderiales bacterium]